jgi:hypothetical protein
MAGSAAARVPAGVGLRLGPPGVGDGVERRSPGSVVALPTRAVAVAAPPRRWSLELNLLGGFRLLVGGELVDVAPSGQKLLALLACGHRQLTRDRIARALWPAAAGDLAQANLRTATHELGRLCPVVVHGTPDHLQLAVGIRVDLDQNVRLAHRVLDGAAVTDDELLAEALAANLYEDLLPEWDDEWLHDHQYRYRKLRLTTLDVLSHSLAAAGHPGAAVQAALAALHGDGRRGGAPEHLVRACRTHPGPGRAGRPATTRDTSRTQDGDLT